VTSNKGCFYTFNALTGTYILLKVLSFTPAGFKGTGMGLIHQQQAKQITTQKKSLNNPGILLN